MCEHHWITCPMTSQPSTWCRVRSPGCWTPPSRRRKPGLTSTTPGRLNPSLSRVSFSVSNTRLTHPMVKEQQVFHTAAMCAENCSFTSHYPKSIFPDKGRNKYQNVFLLELRTQIPKRNKSCHFKGQKSIPWERCWTFLRLEVLFIDLLSVVPQTIFSA